MQLKPFNQRTSVRARERRAERIARRRLSRAPRPAEAPVPRMRFMDRVRAFGRAVIRKERRANREAAQALAGQIARWNAERLMKSAVTDRCAYQRPHVDEKSGVVVRYGDPCGGKLRAHRRQHQDAPRELQCESCGRVYQDERTAAA